MTYEEAIKVIESNRPTSGYTMLCEALDVAKEAIEKQIPKKPKIKLQGTTDYNTKCSCPSCGGFVCADKYCRKCGQALDWGDTDDRA